MAQTDNDLPLASRLCLACGLCCDGTVYGHALSNDQEADRANELGFRMISTPEGKPAFSLPCHYLEGTACTRYDKWKPAVCSEYFCRVQIRAASGEINEDKALNLISKARQLRDGVAQLLPSGLNIGSGRKVLEDLAAKGGVLGKDNAGFAMRMFALERFLDAEFRLSDPDRLAGRK
jgi:uncharacterized protein